MSSELAAPPLSGMLVVDASRMLPGAVLARTLIELGARLIKVEALRGGDPLRAAPPLRAGIGSAFCMYYAGAESLGLDLRTKTGMENLGTLLSRADVFVESFRPGTLKQWGLDLEARPRKYPRLVSCSLPAFASADGVGHDLNFVAMSGLLDRIGSGATTPRVQLADTIAGLLASGSVVSALLSRERGGAGRHITQPLASGPLPLVGLGLLDAALGSPGLSETILSGSAPAYRTYSCGDGRLLACGCLEPKFWVAFTQRIGLPELGAMGLDRGRTGAEAADAVQVQLATKARFEWLALFADLPVTAINRIDEFSSDPTFGPRIDPLFGDLPLPDGTSARVPRATLPGLGTSASNAAPKLRAHDGPLAAEFGLELADA